MLQVDLRELARGPVQTRAELAGDDPLFEGLEVDPGGRGVPALPRARGAAGGGRHRRPVFPGSGRPGGPEFLPPGAGRDGDRPPARRAGGVAARRSPVGGLPRRLPRVVPALWQGPERGPLWLPRGAGGRALAVARPAQGQAPRLKGTRSWRYRSAERPSGRKAPAGRTRRPRPSPCNPAPAAAT